MIKCLNELPYASTFNDVLHVWENLWLRGYIKYAVLPKNIPDTIRNMVIFLYPNNFNILHICSAGNDMFVLTIIWQSCENGSVQS